MLKNTSQSSKNDSWLLYHLLAIIIFLPLPLGSNRIWAWSLVEAWTFLLSAWWLALFFKHKVRLPDYWKRCWIPITSMAGFSLVILIQLLPIQSSSNSSIQVINEFEWRTSSLDPHATLSQWLKTLCYICLSALVITLINSERRLKLVLKTFFFCGLFQACYGSIMTLTNIEHVLFIEKYQYVGDATGTFLSRNHFANYLVICLACGTALLLMNLSAKRSSNWKEAFVKLLNFIISQKMLFRLGIVVTVVATVLSHSRMGFISFFISLIIAGIIWMILTKRVTRNAILLLASFIIIDLLVVSNWFGLEKVKERLQNTSASTETRDEVVRDTRVYISEHMLLGTGGGSYYAVYPNYKQQDVNGYYQHTHNDYLQFISEYGVIGTLFIAFMVISSTLTTLISLKKRNSPILQATGFAILMILIALGVHSLVDFNLQIMANASSTVIILTLAWVIRHVPVSSRARRKQKQEQPKNTKYDTPIA